MCSSKMIRTSIKGIGIVVGIVIIRRLVDQKRRGLDDKCGDHIHKVSVVTVSTVTIFLVVHSVVGLGIRDSGPVEV